MSFTTADDTAKRWMIGPEDGASRFLFLRRTYPPGRLVGLHRHDGEEAQYVVRGTVRIWVDGVCRTCQAGDAAFAPEGIVHGFLVIEEAEIISIREQELITWIVAIEPDGSRRDVAAYGTPPWGREAPEGHAPLPQEETQRLYETTRHLFES
jgi:quercetin dioxygenase-like cupin family protein